MSKEYNPTLHDLKNLSPSELTEKYGEFTPKKPYQGQLRSTKANRNAKCLCGSGLKFKKCCMPFLEEMKR